MSNILPTKIDVLVTGANRGIGLALVSNLLQQNKTVVATYRQSKDELVTLHNEYPHSLWLQQLDVTDQNSIHALSVACERSAIECLINNAGVYGPSPLALGELQAGDWQHVMHTNAIAPLLVTQAVLPMLTRANPSKIAFVSSKMGSITDNSSGGSYLYRSSKAALNAAVKSLSIDLKPQGIPCITLHPGWVKTAMGGPNALINTQTSVSGMLNAISALTLDTTGQFINFDGTELAW